MEFIDRILGHGGSCPHCAKEIPLRALKCPHCSKITYDERLTKLEKEEIEKLQKKQEKKRLWKLIKRVSWILVFAGFLIGKIFSYIDILFLRNLGAFMIFIGVNSLIIQFFRWVFKNSGEITAGKHIGWCPYCTKKINLLATKCPHCTADL